MSIEQRKKAILDSVNSLDQGNKTTISVKCDPAIATALREFVAISAPKYRSQGHVVEVALHKLFNKELS